MAESWDAKYGNDRQSPFFAARLRKIISSLLTDNAGEGALALEIGAGTGPYLSLLSPLFRNVLATDLSPGMVDGIARRIREEGLANVRTQVLDALDMHEIADASLDLIFFVGLLETIPDNARLFREFARVLKPNGCIVGTTSNGNCPWYALRKRLRGGEEHCRTGRYLTKSDVVTHAAKVGLRPVAIVHWGTCPPGMCNPVIGRILDSVETIFCHTPLSRLMGAFSFKLMKPA
jgi:SAM-dependent methyltransferase